MDNYQLLTLVINKEHVEETRIFSEVELYQTIAKLTEQYQIEPNDKNSYFFVTIQSRMNYQDVEYFPTLDKNIKKI